VQYGIAHRKSSSRDAPLAGDTSDTMRSVQPYADLFWYLVFVVERTAHRTYAVDKNTQNLWIDCF
jgi:hypothetical protein